jgi:monofunctional glycosyltransferase
MLIRLAEGQPLRQEWVAYEAMAPALAEAVIAAEDNLFCEQALGFGFRVRIPTKPATDSDRSQPPVPKQTSRAFR